MSMTFGEWGRKIEAAKHPNYSRSAKMESQGQIYPPAETFIKEVKYMEKILRHWILSHRTVVSERLEEAR